jgi:sterol desaturase/sphingolipid hydroxylase (fatty acid hydroxylase superfamily)
MLDAEPWLRLGSFALLAAVFWSAEWFMPRRGDVPARWPRQAINLGLVTLNTLLLRWGVPLLAVDAARIAAQSQWGVLGLLTLPSAVQIVLAVLLLDLAIYWQHRAFHWWPLAWRFHRMHHSDPFFDVTTGVRFHPVEIVASMLIKVALVFAIGAPVLAVVLFEVILNGTSLFNHANLKIPPALERSIRAVLVTPDMHRVHHSVAPAEHNSNFGFNLSLWDRLFGSYCAEPAAGHQDMTIGLTAFRDPEQQTLGRLLLQPFFPKQRA